ncbi:protein Spindly [Xyrichtys novacula]|uniref:Protein Spindly n=1 Tax=Xyrichtys novacula TaxID=13765 RepID=A0AAV1FBU8_XYRNO|nr:protein Spindly [Xyrichtys novacula]
MATEEEVERLRRQLREREEQVHQAAQAGLNLLNQQMELQNRLDEQRVEMTNALEALEQEKYSLQKEVELKSRILESLQSDCDSVKNQQKQQLQEQQEHLERSHSAALSELNNKILRLQSSLEESQLSEKQLKHKLEVQTETLNHKMEELRALNQDTQSSMTSEMMEVQMKIMELEAVKVELEQTLQECQYREQQLALTNSGLQRQLERVTEEKEEREKEAVSWFNALEKSRETNRDLQIQLDQVLQQAQDPNSKGNSLFAELEDKRAAMERQLISMKVQHQSLQKQYAFSKQQQQRMKVQIATLMQLQGSRADPAQLERLQSMLTEKNGEIQNLMTKLQRLEKMEMMTKSQPAPAESSDSHDETYYTDLLKMKLNNTMKDVESLGNELSLQRMKSLSESQRALELERKLFSSDRLLKQAQSDKFKLQLRVEELQNKYEPKDSKKNVNLKRRKEKLPVDTAPSSEDTSHQKVEQVLSVKVDVTNTETAESDTCPTAETLSSKQDVKSEVSEAEQQPAKCVKISREEPVVIPNPRSVSAGSDCEDKEMKIQLQNKREERRKKKRTVEAIDVGSTRTMENECAQQ